MFTYSSYVLFLEPIHKELPRVILTRDTHPHGLLPLDYPGNLSNLHSTLRFTFSQAMSSPTPSRRLNIHTTLANSPPPLTTHHTHPENDESMADPAKEANQRVPSPNQGLATDLRRINQAIDNLSSTAAANQPEPTQSSMVIHQQSRILEQKSPDAIKQRMANRLRGTNSDVSGHPFKNRFCKKASNTRHKPSKDDPPPPYVEDFRIPILHDTIASLEFQKSKLVQTNRLLHVRSSRNLNSFLAAKRAAEESVQEQADVKLRDMQERYQQLLAGENRISRTNNHTVQNPSAVWKHLEETHKTISEKNAALSKLEEELKVMKDKFEKMKMEKEKSDVNIMALVWALVGLAFMWLLGLVLWWDI